MCNDEKKHENTLSSGKVAQPAEQLKLVKVKRIKNSNFIIYNNYSDICEVYG